MHVLHDHRQLDLSASCVAFCPSPQEEDFIAAGTYQLDTQAGHRQGRLYIYSLCCSHNESYRVQECRTVDYPGELPSRTSAVTELAMPGTISCLSFPLCPFLSQELQFAAGIFELKWQQHIGCLALALSDGNLALLSHAAKAASSMSRVQIEEDALATCVDFRPKGSEQDQLLCVSTSTGRLATVQVFRRPGRLSPA
jgi:hypothetical protein